MPTKKCLLREDAQQRMVAVITPTATGPRCRDATRAAMLTNLSRSWQPGTPTTTTADMRRYRPMSAAGDTPARLASKNGRRLNNR